MFRRLLVLAVLAMLSPGRSAIAAQPLYEIKQHYREGQEFSLLLSDSLTVTFQLHNHGDLIAKVTRNDASQTLGKLKILQTHNGLPVAEQIEFSKTSGYVFQRSGEPVQQRNFLLAGKTVVVRRDPFGGVSCDVDGANDSRVSRVLRNWLSRDIDYYPDHPVAIHEKWDVSKNFREHFSHLAPNDQIIAICRLESVKATAAGGQVATVSVSCALMSQDKVLMMSGTLDGSVQIDLATGRVIRADITGSVDATGSVSYRTRSGPTSGEGAGTGQVGVHQLCVPYVPGSQKVAHAHKANAKPQATASAK